ncbi:hypothetical protein CkaCkLH20_03868 [Colletotrichum karsti]|uniref:BTB domain-containing protein n=1 Tax=Colletotrichum karsti TaxID=1095194 RepID=A0A9P6ID61_9PEZI|nr:uncharacterized protein CkaCkLH20_03868 [Colletotrichum karsti]KAF9878376.1 hypothetical protein CkaCkLH20_03868 [Colletotrichum karsti]
MAWSEPEVKRPKLDHRGGCDDEGRPVFVDDDGDLSLHVGPEGKTATYVVCAKTLARHSPIFRRMLFGGFKESKPLDGSDWVIELPEDSPEGFKIFLDMVHGWFGRVPEELSLDQLVDVLIITEKYDATAITRPWARGWLKAVEDSTSGFGLLCAAWELGDMATFEKMILKIIDEAECSADESRRLIYDGYYADEIKYLEPPGLFEAIKELRSALVAAHMAPYVEIYDVLAKPGGSKLPFCPLTDEKAWRTCDNLVLGSLIMGLMRSNVNITAKDPADDFTGSLESLKGILRRLRIEATDHPYSRRCEDNLQGRRQRGTAQEMEIRAEHVIIKQEHVDYITKQAHKTGLDKIDDDED